MEELSENAPQLLGIVCHWEHTGAELNIESIQRARLWRYLVGDDSVDVSYEGALTRMEI